MKNNIKLFPVLSSNEVVVQFTSDFILDKSFFINVPSDFYGYIYINQKLTGRIEACNEINLLKYVGKNYSGSSVRIAFIRKNDLPFISWGFGDINIKNDKLEETYRVGANGKYLLKIVDATKLINSFGNEENINIEMITSKTKSIITTIGKPLLSKYFADSMISVFEINSYGDDFREKMFDILHKEESLKNIGLELSSLTLNSIHVNEDDMEFIRNKINNNKIEDAVSIEQLKATKRDIINSIKEFGNKDAMQEIQKLKNEIAKLSENQEIDAIVDEIDNLRVELTESIKNISNLKDDNKVDLLFKEIADLKKQIEVKKTKDDSKKLKSMLDELEQKFSEKIDSSFSSIKCILENNFDEKVQNNIPLYETAKEDWLNSLKLTTDLQLDKSETDDDYASVAGLICSNVENNLMNKFNISHKEKDFYMTEDEFNSMVNTVLIDGKSLFKDTFQPRYINFKDLAGKYVEMPLEFRFIKCGLSAKQAFQAAKDWTILNKFRHRSDENLQKLQNILNERKMTKKEFLEYVLSSYRNFGLYTRD